MIYLAALLLGTASILFIFGLREIFKRDVKASKFSAFRYDASKELDIPRVNPRERISNLHLGRNILLFILGGTLFGIIAFIISGKLFIAVLAFPAGIVAPKLWDQRGKKKYENTLAMQIEQAVESMSIVIRSGGGMPDAIEKALTDAEEPFKKELEQVSSELKLGVPEPNVFARLADRVDIEEMEMLSVATTLQQEGLAVNMANVFKQIQNNIRTRQAFQEEVRAITSENRMAVWIVACVPVFTIAIMRLFAPDFIAPLFETFIGGVTLTVCAILVVTGVIWALRIANNDDYM